MVQWPGWERPEQRGCCGVLVSRCPCSRMWGRRAKFGVLEHHLLAYSPRRSQGGLRASLHHGQDCGGGIAESREKLLEKLQGLLWASMGEWSKGKETKLTPFAAIRTSTEVGWVSSTWQRGQGMEKGMMTAPATQQGGLVWASSLSQQEFWIISI